jgi:hypothetical protein
MISVLSPIAIADRNRRILSAKIADDFSRTQSITFDTLDTKTKSLFTPISLNLYHFYRFLILFRIEIYAFMLSSVKQYM